MPKDASLFEELRERFANTPWVEVLPVTAP